MAVEAAIAVTPNEAARIAHVSSLVGELARLEVSGLSQDDFLETYDAVARLGRLADALRARFGGDLARRSAPDLPGGGLARRQGFGNAGTMAASVTGGSRAGALRAIDAGRALIPDVATMLPEPAILLGAGQACEVGQSPTPRQHRYPAVASTVLAGDLSVDAAGLVTAGLETLTDRGSSDQFHLFEQRLVDKAVNLAVHEVRRLVASAVARADLHGHQEQERRQYEQRYSTWSEDHTGMVTLTGRLDPVTAAP